MKPTIDHGVGLALGAVAGILIGYLFGFDNAVGLDNTATAMLISSTIGVVGIVVVAFIGFISSAHAQERTATAAAKLASDQRREDSRRMLVAILAELEAASIATAAALVTIDNGRAQVKAKAKAHPDMEIALTWAYPEIITPLFDATAEKIWLIGHREMTRLIISSYSAIRDFQTERSQARPFRLIDVGEQLDTIAEIVKSGGKVITDTTASIEEVLATFDV